MSSPLIRPLSYLLVGGFATVVHYGALIFLVDYTAAAPGPAAAAGGALGALAAYMGNSRFTFADSVYVRSRTWARFAAVACAGALFNGVLVECGTRLIHLHYLVSQCAATGAALLLTYHFNRKWTFK